MRDRLETDLRDDLVDPASRQALGLGQAQQVVEGTAAGVHSSASSSAPTTHSGRRRSA